MRDVVWPLVFIYAKRQAVRLAIEDGTLPTTAQMPGAWDLERLKYAPPSHWWDAAWKGIHEIQTYPRDTNQLKKLLGLNGEISKNRVATRLNKKMQSERLQCQRFREELAQELTVREIKHDEEQVKFLSDEEKICPVYQGDIFKDHPTDTTLQTTAPWFDFEIWVDVANIAVFTLWLQYIAIALGSTSDTDSEQSKRISQFYKDFKYDFVTDQDPA